MGSLEVAAVQDGKILRQCCHRLHLMLKNIRASARLCKSAPGQSSVTWPASHRTAWGWEMFVKQFLVARKTYTRNVRAKKRGRSDLPSLYFCTDIGAIFGTRTVSKRIDNRVLVETAEKYSNGHQVVPDHGWMDGQTFIKNTLVILYECIHVV